MKEQLNLRVSNLTRRQLDQLMKWWGTSQTETVTVIIDRAYIQERNRIAMGAQNLTDKEIEEQLRQLADDTETDDYPLTEQEANEEARQALQDEN